MNYEVDSYTDALKDFPSKELQLETRDNTFYYFKADVFKGLISYSTSPTFGANIQTITTERAKEVSAMNKRGIKPDLLEEIIENNDKPVPVDYENVVGQDSLTRFDTVKKRTAKPSPKRNNRPQLNKEGQGENKTNNPRLIKKNDQNKE